MARPMSHYMITIGYSQTQKLILRVLSTNSVCWSMQDGTIRLWPCNIPWTMVTFPLFRHRTRFTIHVTSPLSDVKTLSKRSKAWFYDGIGSSTNDLTIICFVIRNPGNTRVFAGTIYFLSILSFMTNGCSQLKEHQSNSMCALLEALISSQKTKDTQKKWSDSSVVRSSEIQRVFQNVLTQIFHVEIPHWAETPQVYKTHTRKRCRDSFRCKHRRGSGTPKLLWNGHMKKLSFFKCPTTNVLS